MGAGAPRQVALRAQAPLLTRRHHAQHLLDEPAAPLAVPRGPGPVSLTEMRLVTNLLDLPAELIGLP